MSCCWNAICDFESADWPRNILKALFAEVDELGCDLPQNLIVGRRRDADTARFCDALEPSRNIYAIAKNVMWLDNHVADVDTDTELKAPIFHVFDCKFINTGLEKHRSPNRFDRARKLCQEPVPGVLDNAAAVIGYCRGDSVREERCQFGMRGLFVIVHEPRVASHVGGQYR